MRILMTRWLARFARQEGVGDGSLTEAIERAQRGIVDADLGDGLIKQRVSRPRKGRRNGYRMIIGYQANHRAVFIYGFAKNALDNIDESNA